MCRGSCRTLVVPTTKQRNGNSGRIVITELLVTLHHPGAEVICVVTYVPTLFKFTSFVFPF